MGGEEQQAFLLWSWANHFQRGAKSNECFLREGFPSPPTLMKMHVLMVK